uniref:G-protein coupled receptors family 1 profile domain-containing protein n=1 Tax=Knipowitschia caucasica TaxID=637954 RepID=A0AAV2JQI1_KNICA
MENSSLRTTNLSVWSDLEVGEAGEAGVSGVRVLVGCVLFLLIVSTLLGNTLVCAAVVKFRHLRSKVTNFFVISLAVSDLFVAVLVMPWEAITELVCSWCVDGADLCGCRVLHAPLQSSRRLSRAVPNQRGVLITGAATTRPLMAIAVSLKLHLELMEVCLSGALLEPTQLEATLEWTGSM